jgi:hypothetical protein
MTRSCEDHPVSSRCWGLVQPQRPPWSCLPYIWTSQRGCWCPGIGCGSPCWCCPGAWLFCQNAPDGCDTVEKLQPTLGVHPPHLAGAGWDLMCSSGIAPALGCWFVSWWLDPSFHNLYTFLTRYSFLQVVVHKICEYYFSQNNRLYVRLSSIKLWLHNTEKKVSYVWEKHDFHPFFIIYIPQVPVLCDQLLQWFYFYI